jgi:phosphohistidine phosphatase
MRHAEAVDSAETDFARALTAHGVDQAKIIGRKLKGFVEPEYFLVSPAQRTKETIQIILDFYGFDESICHFESKIYEADVEDLKDVIKSLPQEVNNAIMIGHNPAISDLFSMWTGYYSYFPTAQAVVLKGMTERWEDIFNCPIEVVVKVCCKE